MVSEMSESTMLPDEASWANMSSEELRMHLLALKRSANAVTLKVQEYEKETKRLLAERATLLAENERLTRTLKSVQQDAETDREMRENALMLLALYRELLLKGDSIAISLFDASVHRISKITARPTEDMKKLAQQLFGMAVDETIVPRRKDKATKKRSPRAKAAPDVTVRTKNAGNGKTQVTARSKKSDLRDVFPADMLSRGKL